MIAVNPTDLENLGSAPAKPTAVRVSHPPKREEPPPPTEPTVTSPPLLASLAPDSFAPAADLSGGVGFGGGGSGPTIAGGGGFGDEAGQVVRDQTSIDRAPRATVRSAPDYPPEARQRGVSGYVILRIFIGPGGSIEDIRVDKSEPAGFFEQAAIRAIRQWKFEPGVQRGQAVAAWTTQRIKFELN